MSDVSCMRNPAPRVLLVAVLAVVVVAAVGAPVAGDAVSTSLSPSSEPAVAERTASAATASTAVSPTAITPALTSPTADAAWQVDDEFDPNTETNIRIDLSPDRDARWTVSVRYELTNAEERSAFETAASRYLAGEIGPDAEVFEGFAREASRNVDRTMRIDDVDRDAEVHEDASSFEVAGDDAVAVGELRLTFVWTAFLAEDGENLVLGDALTTPNDGTWLRSLADDQTIEVGTPDGYSVTSTPGSTAARLVGGDVIIEGPQLFEDDERVDVVYAPSGVVGPPWAMLAGAIVIGALLIAGSIIGYRRLGGDDPADDTGGRAGAADGADGAASAETTAGTGAGPEPGVGPGAGAGHSAGPEGDDASEEDLSLLSDEERVERLLENNGGRMRQADIVAETGWSDAKVSQLLSAMADADRVEKLRLGRENLISLPDDDGSGTGPNAGSDGGEGGDDGAETGENSEAGRFR